MSLKKPTWKAPTAPPDWPHLPLDEAVAALKTHLQTAVIIELYTIPMYLYAAYSIKNNPLSTYKIISVVKQEMLHLSLSGNILCSIGGTPRVYGNEFTPKFPREIFFEKLELNLKPGSKDTIKTFMEVEAPYQPPTLKMAAGILPSYHSIGEFYEDLKHGIKIIDERMTKAGRQFFLHSTFPKQFNRDDGSWADDDLAVITDISVAERSMEIIIEQGEGSTGKGAPSGIQSHYQVFKELYEEHPLDCYDVEENIDPSKHTSEKSYKLMIASDAAYSYLLMTIEKMWQYDGAMRGRLVTNNIMNLMLTILRPVALFLAAQPLASGKHASCPYRRYDFATAGEELAELKRMMKEGLAEYPSESSLKGVTKEVEGLIDLAQL